MTAPWRDTIAGIQCGEVTGLFAKAKVGRSVLVSLKARHKQLRFGVLARDLKDGVVVEVKQICSYSASPDRNEYKVIPIVGGGFYWRSILELEPLSPLGALGVQAE